MDLLFGFPGLAVQGLERGVWGGQMETQTRGRAPERASPRIPAPPLHLPPGLLRRPLLPPHDAQPAGQPSGPDSAQRSAPPGGADPQHGSAPVWPQG